MKGLFALSTSNCKIWIEVPSSIDNCTKTVSFFGLNFVWELLSFVLGFQSFNLTEIFNRTITYNKQKQNALTGWLRLLRFAITSSD